jgi:thiosulfate dehydrogenase [quinone] large subunit
MATRPTQAVALGPPLDTRLARLSLAFVRIVFGCLWLANAAWKVPPDFDGLRHFTSFAVTNPVFGPYSYVVEHVILTHLTPFGYGVMVSEAAIGAFLILGLATRFWALVGLAQAVAIMLSVLNAPNEWTWAYYMLISGQLLLWATAAGRAYGLDGVLRPGWASSSKRVWNLLGMAS